MLNIKQSQIIEICLYSLVHSPSPFYPMTKLPSSEKIWQKKATIT
jgi:hypothetical protein